MSDANKPEPVDSGTIHSRVMVSVRKPAAVERKESEDDKTTEPVVPSPTQVPASVSELTNFQVPISQNNPASRRFLPTRKSLLRMVIGLLIFSALIGIIAILTGGLDTVGGEVLGTTAEIDFAAILCLCYVGKTTSKLHGVVQVLGFVTTVLATVISIYLTWSPDQSGASWPWQSTAFLSVLAIGSAQASLLLPSMNYNAILERLVTATLVMIAVLAGLITYLIFVGFNDGAPDAFWRVLGVVLILDVLGTLLIPILRRFGPPKESA